MKMVQISKHFGHVKVLEDVDFTVNEKEIVGLVGDNGAGKTTLIKILVGVYAQDSGEIFFEGRKVKWASPGEARAARLEAAHQNLGLLDHMTISRNFFLGKELRRGPLLDMKRMNRDSVRALESFGIKTADSNENVRNLSGGERQAIVIAKAKYFGAKLLVLDEPTASLSIEETRKVMDVMLETKAKGAGIIFITHNIRHVYSVADRIVCLSHGRKILDMEKKHLGIEDIENTISHG